MKMDIVLLLKSIGVGFLVSCGVSLLLVLGIVTTPFAALGFIPVWIIAAIFYYQNEK